MLPWVQGASHWVFQMVADEVIAKVLSPASCVCCTCPFIIHCYVVGCMRCSPYAWSFSKLQVKKGYCMLCWGFWHSCVLADFQGKRCFRKELLIALHTQRSLGFDLFSFAGKVPGGHCNCGSSWPQYSLYWWQTLAFSMSCGFFRHAQFKSYGDVKVSTEISKESPGG